VKKMSSLGWRTKPTRYELLKLKDRLNLASRAHDLLEDKYGMLNSELQKVRGILNPFEKKMQSDIKEAYSLFLRAVTHSGIRKIELAAKSITPNDEIEIDWDKVQGLTVPRIKSRIKKRNPLERGYGLLETTSAIDDVAEALESLTIFLVTISELRNLLRILERELDRTRIRVSALEKVLIPYLEKEIKKIEIKLEERSRERQSAWRWVSSNQELLTSKTN